MVRACHGASQPRPCAESRRRRTARPSRCRRCESAGRATGRANVQPTDSQPTAPKCVSVPSGARPMMRPAASDAIPDASCWIDALKLMKLPRSLGSTLPVTKCGRRAEPAGNEYEEQHRQRDDPGERQRRKMGLDENRSDRDQREDREHALLAVAIGEAADHLRRDERRRAAGEIDHREIRFRDADIGDVIGGDERDDREHRAHQHDDEGEGPQVVGHPEYRPQLLHRAAARVRRDVRRQAAE